MKRLRQIEIVFEQQDFVFLQDFVLLAEKDYVTFIVIVITYFLYTKK